MRLRITRRDLLRGAAYGGVGAALGLSTACSRQTASAAQAEEGPPPSPASARVALVRRADALDGQGRADAAVVREMLDLAMTNLNPDMPLPAAWSGRFAPADRVGLKANVMMNHVRPEVLLAIHDSLVEHAGVASDAIAAWDRNRGAVGREQLARPDSEWGELPATGYDANSVARICSEWATALVNVPSLKCHWLSGVAIALKNWCGAVTNIGVFDGPGTAFQIHGDSCADMGVFQAMPDLGGKARLVVVDALEPYYERGPQTDPEYFYPYGGLIVGADAVAVDTVGTMLLQAIRDKVFGTHMPISPPPKHIGVAETKYGLGVSDPNRITIVRLGDTDGMLV